MRALAILTLIVAGPALAQAGNNFVRPPVVLEEFGVFCPDEPSGQMEAPDTERGVIDLITGDPRVDFHTDIVPGELGLGFGLRFRLAEGELPVIGRVIITHPPFGANGVTRESYEITIDSFATSMTQFDFDDDYEIQHGTWTMGIEIGGEILLQQSFTVVPEGTTPVSTKLCDGPPLMS